MVGITALEGVIRHYTGQDQFEVMDIDGYLCEPSRFVRSALIAAISGSPRKLAQLLRIAAENGVCSFDSPEANRWGTGLMIEAITNHANQAWSTITAAQAPGETITPGTRLGGDIARIHDLQQSLATLDAQAAEQTI